MSKMNWDRERQERRAARQGSEWVSSEGVNPGLYVSARTDTRSSGPTSGGPKKKRKKTKRKVAGRNMEVQVRGKASGASKPPVTAGALTQALPKVASSLKCPPSAVASKVNKKVTAPVFPQPDGLRRTHRVRDPLSLPEIQELTIRLYKAVSQNRMPEAASLAFKIRSESLCHVENSTGKKTGN
jgi:hypothetical protein